MSQKSLQNETYANGSFKYKINRRHSKIYRRIFNYIAEHQSDIPDLSITQLAQRINTSPSNITRFCQANGTAGYSEFKHRLKNDPILISEGNIFSPGKKVPHLLREQRDYCSKSVSECINSVDPAVLQLVALKISQAHSLLLCGHGGSAVAAQFAEILFLQMGIPCNCYQNLPLAHAIAGGLTNKDVALFFSGSGSTPTVYDTLEIARKTGAFCVLITCSINSPASKLANATIYFHFPQKEDIRFYYAQKLCEMTICGLLQNIVLSQNYDNFVPRIVDTKDAFFSWFDKFD